MIKSLLVLRFFRLLVLFFLIVNISISITYGQESCSYQKLPIDHWTLCGSHIPISCHEPAHLAHVKNVSVPIIAYEAEVICPWGPITSHLSYSSFVFGFILIIVSSLDMMAKSKGLICLTLIVGFLTMGFVSTAFIFMILDVVKGSDASYDYPFISAPGAYPIVVIDQAVYIANVIFFLLTFLSISGLLIFAIKAGAILAKEGTFQPTLHHEADDLYDEII